MSDEATKPTAEDRKEVAECLRELADKIEGDETITGMTAAFERPARELDPLAGECPMDGYRHFEPGSETIIELVVRRGR